MEIFYTTSLIASSPRKNCMRGNQNFKRNTENLKKGVLDKLTIFSKKVINDEEMVVIARTIFRAHPNIKKRYDEKQF